MNRETSIARSASEDSAPNVSTQSFSRHYRFPTEPLPFQGRAQKLQARRAIRKGRPLHCTHASTGRSAPRHAERLAMDLFTVKTEDYPIEHLWMMKHSWYHFPNL